MDSDSDSDPDSTDDSTLRTGEGVLQYGSVAFRLFGERAV